MRRYLVGFMASGKTTVGRYIADQLDLALIDTDQDIERTSGRTIRELFETEGEAAFRELEFAALERTETFQNVVVATGGGAMVPERNRELLAMLGTTFWLDVPWPVVHQRLVRQIDQHRPLARDISSAQQLFFERRAVYEKADCRIPVTANDSVGAVAARIRRLL